MQPVVGLIGLGLMGGPMGQNLLRAGFPLVVWNRSRQKADDLVRNGAKLGADPQDVAAKADVLITIVSDPAALEEVLFGARGAVQALRMGSTLIDSSTVSPELARRIASACAERGVDFLDAPVTGGTWGAAKGELVFMIGGRAEVLERVKPVLEAMGKKLLLLGPNGVGQTVKLAMNLLLALQVDALAEALALVVASGVPAEKMLEVLQSSMARSGVLDVKAPMMLKGEFPASFPLRLMHKDVHLALELARSTGVALPCGTAAFATYSDVMNKSTDDPDFSAVARFWTR